MRDYGVALVDRAEVERLSRLIEFDGLHQVPLRSKELQGFSASAKAAFCKSAGLYQIVTTELVHWCRQRIAGRTAIEVAAGRSGLGRALGIPQSDSYLVRSKPDVRDFCAQVGEYTGEFPAAVECLTANEAVEKYRPQVVLACWLSQHGSSPVGSPYGADEAAMLDLVDEYILIGNGVSHGRKRILTKPHELLFRGASWLQSRSMTPSENAIWVWPGAASKYEN